MSTVGPNILIEGPSVALRPIWPAPSKGPGVWAAYGVEDELMDMCDELPEEGVIEEIVERLRIVTLRHLTVGLLKHEVNVAKDPTLYPVAFVRELSSWLATAQESIASRRGVAKVLRDRDQLRQQR